MSTSVVLCFLVFDMVVSFCVVHLRDGSNRIPRYVYGSFCVRTGIFWFL